MVEDVCGMASTYISDYQGIYRDLHLPAVIVAGCLVLVALVLSIYLVFQHLRSYTNPAEQKWIVAILFMVPFYACESIISLMNSRLSLACDILRNCYEAFALYAFGCYLVACLGGEERVIELLEDESQKKLTKPLLEEEDEKRALQQSSFRNFFLHPNMLGKNLYTIVKFGFVQYMILKTVCSFLALLLELFEVYGDGEFKWYYGYPYIAAVLNFSQMWALYCLVQFYNATHRNLQSIKPLAKFISFKAIVFATWWQGVGIQLLCALHVLPTEGKFQRGLQDFLICIEMAIAAVAHVFVFSAKPYCFLPVSEDVNVTAQESKYMLKLVEDDKDEPDIVEKMETHVKAPGTSVTKSAQDVVLGGGERVVKDVVLTINQAIEPVGKGVTRIQETFHHMSLGSDKEGGEVNVEDHIKENITKSDSHMEISEEKTAQTGGKTDR